MRWIALLVVLATLEPSLALAQSSLVGKYTGSLTAPRRGGGGERQWGMIVEIKTAEDGKLTGSISNPMGIDCPGEMPAEGTYEGNKIVFVATQTRQVQGCGRLSFRGVHEGNKLIGQMPYNGAPRDITLSK